MFDEGLASDLQDDELVVDLFAGGGGTSEGIEEYLGYPPHIAVNHDPIALAVHALNHPHTIHLRESVWRVSPKKAANGRPVGLVWLSPDCRDFSKAKGGTPVRKHIRALCWSGVYWAEQVRPRVIILENVEEFQDAGPCIRNAKGELYPDPARRGETFRKFVAKLRRLGYVVEWRELRACDYGAPTIRKRLFLIARCDGEPIIWPEPTHGEPDSLEVRAGLRQPWRTAAEIIDWSLPCPSIFMTREEAREFYRQTGIRVNRPLADNTLARIARGVQRYVIDAAEPFIVPLTHQGAPRVYSVNEPMRTITGAHRGEHAIVVPTLVQTGYGEREGQAPRSLDIHRPLGTIVAGGGKHALVAAFLAQHNGCHENKAGGHDARDPISTITGRGTQQQLVAAHLLNLKGSDRRMSAADAPCPTLCAEGNHIAAVQAFLIKYFGTAVGQNVREPLHTDTAKPRFGLVMVHGEPHQIVDIGMRMLSTRERFLAQGFPSTYQIDVEFDGEPISEEAKGRLCGNAVCPPMARAIVAANYKPRRMARAA